MIKRCLWLFLWLCDTLVTVRIALTAMFLVRNATPNYGIPPGKHISCLTDNFVLTVISRIVSHEPRGGAGAGVGNRVACTEPSCAWPGRAAVMLLSLLGSQSTFWWESRVSCPESEAWTPSWVLLGLLCDLLMSSGQSWVQGHQHAFEVLGCQVAAVPHPELTALSFHVRAVLNITLRFLS